MTVASFKSNVREIGACLALLSCAGVLFSTSTFAQESASSDLHRLRDLNAAITASEKLLAKYPRHDFSPTVVFQLSDLYLRQASLQFQQEMLVYEQAERMRTYAADEVAPIAPRIDLGESIRMSQSLLEKWPEIHFRDKVLYRIALCYAEQGDMREATEHYLAVAAESDDPALLEETYFRLGEYYFDQKDYPATIKYYGRVLDSWENPFFDMALYKLGWSYYITEDYAQAISIFIYLIEDVDLLDEVQTSKVSEAKTDLRQEAIEYISVCFSEFGGPYKAADFLRERKQESYAEAILLHLASLYQERNFYTEAIETLNILIDYYPLKPAVAHYQKQIVESYELAGDKQQADLARARLIETYGPGSDWFSGVNDAETRNEVITATEEFLYTLASEAQLRGQTSQDGGEYNKAISWYKAYLDKFPSHERAHQVQFYLGECYYDLAEYAQAAESYYAVSVSYPSSEFAETAAYNRILAFGQLLQQSTSVDSVNLSLFNFLGHSESIPTVIRSRNDLQAQIMQASNDFFLFHTLSPKTNEVLINFAQFLFDLKHFDLAGKAYQEVAGRSMDNPYLTRATFMAGQSDYEAENFVAAEGWFRKVVSQFPDSVAYVEKAGRLLASSQFRSAEVYTANGDSLMAALAFENVARTVTDSAVAERALLEAAQKFEDLGSRSKAIELYEAVFTRFPKSEFVDESLFKAGALCEETEQFERAAVNYTNLYRHDSGSKYAAEALFAAARSFENLNRPELARQHYAQYTSVHKDDPDRYLEAAFRNADIAYSQKNFQAARKQLQFVIDSQKRFLQEQVEVDNYLPANAQFLLAEISFLDFQAIELTPPVERKLKRKQTLFQRVIKEYTEAAKYKVAEWATAASFKIGRTFEEFAAALLSAPRPANLSPGDLMKYNQQLQQRVLPFKQKAQRTYETVLQNAAENNIVNTWVMESERRLNALNVELGIRPMNASKGADS